MTYFDPSPSSGSPFRRAVAVGPEIVDPFTDLCWIPLMRTDLKLDMVVWPMVVDVAPQ